MQIITNSEAKELCSSKEKKDVHEFIFKSLDFFNRMLVTPKVAYSCVLSLLYNMAISFGDRKDAIFLKEQINSLMDDVINNFEKERE